MTRVRGTSLPLSAPPPVLLPSRAPPAPSLSPLPRPRDPVRLIHTAGSETYNIVKRPVSRVTATRCDLVSVCPQLEIGRQVEEGARSSVSKSRFSRRQRKRGGDDVSGFLREFSSGMQLTATHARAQCNVIKTTNVSSNRSSYTRAEIRLKDLERKPFQTE